MNNLCCIVVRRMSHSTCSAPVRRAHAGHAVLPAFFHRPPGAGYVSEALHPPWMRWRAPSRAASLRMSIWQTNLMKPPHICASLRFKSQHSTHHTTPSQHRTTWYPDYGSVLRGAIPAILSCSSQDGLATSHPSSHRCTRDITIIMGTARRHICTAHRPGEHLLMKQHVCGAHGEGPGAARAARAGAGPGRQPTPTAHQSRGQG